MSDRKPPQNLEAEMSVLGSVLLSRTALEDVTGIVGPGDFYKPSHEMIFEVVLRMDGRGEPVDAMTVAGELTRAGILSRVGGHAYLHDLVAFVPSAANAGYYAAVVAEMAVYRRMVAAGTRIAQMGYESAEVGGEVDAAVEAAKDETDGIGGVSRAAVTTFADVADEAIDTIGKARFIPTPWRGLNRLIYGWQPSHMYVVGARPGTGKTVFAVQAVLDAALGKHADPVGVAYYTWEMSGPRLYQRALAHIAGVDGERMMRGDVELTDAEWNAVARADGILRPLPFVVEDAAGWTADRTAAHAKATHRRMPLEIVVIDHIGRTVAPDPRMSEQQMLSHAANTYLDLAHLLGCAVIVVSQLNRGPAERRDRKPRIEDLRGSDVMEQNADGVMLLDRDAARAPSVLNMLVAKNRDGQAGAVELVFEGAYSRVSDRSPDGWSPGDAAQLT